ncbi:M20/M25/M40 family metallo-hydrolase [Pseudofulvibacter geojedonensis]|uniref:Vacuolar membrane protease n=1 Tax=Pseudofulvibacter geojedonensis TaxID=1123758 RepID=A0ABW3I263_9FLAO
MLKKLISLIIIAISAYLAITLQLPSGDYIETPDNTQFSNKKAYEHVKVLGSTQHYSGSQHHKSAKEYVINQLKELGLEVTTQEGNSYSDWGNFTKAKNIITRIKGTENSKALVLMTHYDSAPHSAYGASDAGSGVATILEGIRAFLANKTPHKNDIIILITDAEELGLNGAKLFVENHPWVNEIGLILNFEARGSGGPSYTLVEANEGNANLMSEYIKANPNFPVANSLAYSIYKKMPNDTDLTVFRKGANIQGFNFAFIDDHYDYHTALDTPERLDNNTLSHQASYLMPLLNHFSNLNLSNLNATENLVYFNSPIGMHSYSYDYIIPLTGIAVFLFIVILIFGKRHKKLNIKEIGKGFIVFISALVINCIIGFFGWKAILTIYPHYNEILQGFPYNAHWYIVFFATLALAISFLIYKKVYQAVNTKELMVAPIFFWLLINIYIALELKGANFFIIPIFFVLALLFFLIRKEKPNLLAVTILCLPAIYIFTPFIEQFPIALGMKLSVAASALTTLLFGLLLPVFGFIRRKKLLGYTLLITSLIIFIVAHSKSDFTSLQPKPNSLVLYTDEDTHKSYWLTYDSILDNWNQGYFQNLTNDSISINFNSKYNTKFTQIADSKHIHIPAGEASVMFDTIVDNKRNIKLCLIPNREINTIHINSNTKPDFDSFSINGTTIKTKGSNSRFLKDNESKMAVYYVVDKQALEIDFTIDKNKKPHIELLEISYDLLDHKELNVAKREDNMIPKPFVINDAIISKQTINFNIKKQDSTLIHKN